MRLMVGTPFLSLSLSFSYSFTFSLEQLLDHHHKTFRIDEQNVSFQCQRRCESLVEFIL